MARRRMVGLTDGLGSRWSASGRRDTQPLRFRQTLRAGVEFIDNLHQDQQRHASSTIRAVLRYRPLVDAAGAVRAERDQARAAGSSSTAACATTATSSSTASRRARPLIVLPSSTQSFKYLYGSAFRAPNEYELNDVYFGDRVHALRPEAIDTHEFVWERYFNDRLRTSVSTYWYKADRLITTALDDTTFLGATVRQPGAGAGQGSRARGADAAPGRVARARQLRRCSARSTSETDDELPNSPRHMAKARVSLPGPTGRSFVSIEGQYLSSRATLARPARSGDGLCLGRVAAAATANVTLVQPLGRAWELSGGIRNLFDTKYADPVSDQHLQEAVEQNGRTARIGLTWKFQQAQ